MKNKKGFTLTEVLIVIVLIGIVISIAIPSITSVRKRMNERLFEEKKQEILLAAELYGKDKDISTDTIIYVHTLLSEKYINKDIDYNEDNCTGDNTENGCIINPIDDSILNNAKIILRKVDNVIIAVWNGEEASTSNEKLVRSVKTELGCTTITEDEPCIYEGNNPDNYLYYSGIMWRIIGVYNINDKEVVKMITNDNVVWDNETSA